MTYVLRDYQAEDVAELERRWRAGEGTRLGLVWATGLGKTSAIAATGVRTVHDGGRTIAIAHRRELLGQITERVAEFDPSIAVGLVKGTVDQCRRRFIVASAQTIMNPRRLERLGRFNKIIVDEAHHAAAPTYVETLKALGAWDGVPTLGVTATMTREDKKSGLGDVWEDIVADRDIRWAVQNGWLVPPRGRVVVADHLDLERVSLNRDGDYAAGEVGAMVAQDADQIARAWIEHGEDRITGAFSPTVEAASALADALRSARVPVAEVYGDTDEGTRDKAYRDLHAGRIRVLSSVMVPTEGFDCPPMSCILNCRPTRSRTLFTQIVGRGLRLYPGKRDCLVLDTVGAARGMKLFGLTELLPGAEQDTTAVDCLPCRDCGQIRALCACPPALRDPDGGRRKLEGPARYAEVDLLAQTGLRWLRTTQGVRFLLAGDPQRVFYLWPDTNDFAQTGGTWSVITANLKGDFPDPGNPARGVPLSLEQAQELAEREALALQPDLREQQERPWRSLRASGKPGQLAYARMLGIPNPEGFTRGRLSEEIDIVMASGRLEQGRKAAV